MTDTNITDRTPSKFDYASPIQFRFKMTKLPNVEFFVQTANIPAITLGETSIETPLKEIPIPGDKIRYSSLDISFLVDENLNNYKEIHDWITGLGFPEDHKQFKNLLTTGSDRFPGTTSSTAATGTSISQATSDGATYSDAILTVLNSKNIAKTEIRFQNVYPTSLGGLSYDIKSGDVEYITVNASFSYMYYDIVQISSS
jgi:hypothetical protein